MQRTDLKKYALPDSPGVYRFYGPRKKLLYVGKATSLKDRVRSYFANDLLHTRGKHIVDMVTLATSVDFTKTDSVLDALILEASLIKKLQPKYNTDEKDDKSWNYVVITKEDFPRILVIRERSLVMHKQEEGGEWLATFGPFTSGGQLTAALKIIRKIFPFRDKCTPGSGKPCFMRQIGLCPGVCTSEIDKREYKKRIRDIILFFSGKKAQLERQIRKNMQLAAKSQDFENAVGYRDQLYALEHIRDTTLITEEVREVSQQVSASRRQAFRIEAYDVAHISGKYTVGVMTVVEDGRPKRSDYRKFKIRIAPERSNDTLHLAEILRRRFGHSEWPRADLIVIDGGIAQKRIAEAVLKEVGIETEVVSVVKDERHKPKDILGKKEIVDSFRRGILIGNAESHRFAVDYHRYLREKALLK